MKFYKAIALFVVMCLGCAPTLDHTQIKEVASNVYTEDGVDRVEAIFIAQDFLIRKSFYDRFHSLKPFRIIERTAFYKDGEPIVYVVPPRDRRGIKRERTWTLYFRDKKRSFLEVMPTVSAFRIIINADDGEIIAWGIDDLRSDKDIYSYEKIYEQDMI